MGDILNLVARLRAHEAGRAVRCATHLQVTIQSHALVICPLAMAGEDTTLHGIAIGKIGEPPQIRTVPDPRMRDEQYELIRWAGTIIETYFAECRAHSDFPQIWVSSHGAAGQLDILADRLRFTRGADDVKRVGELLTYVTERWPVAGQQALVTATGALSAHYATGQQNSEDEHLGTILTWIDPPEETDIRAAIDAAECQPMGAKTDPEFDRNTLQPRIANFNAARKAGATARELKWRRDDIEAQLLPVITPIYDAVQRAVTFLQGRFPPAAVLTDLAAHEASTFASFMQARDEGVLLPYRDKPKAGVFKITERETSIQNLEAGALFGDRMAQAKARLAGHILSGQTANASSTKVPRKTILRFDVETAQAHLHLRAGDKLARLDNPNFLCEVEDVERDGAITRVSLRITAGMKSVGNPSNGTPIEFAAPPPNWGWFYKTRVKMAARLEVMPWTHGGDMPPPEAAPSMPKPENLLAAIEGLK